MKIVNYVKLWEQAVGETSWSAKDKSNVAALIHFNTQFLDETGMKPEEIATIEDARKALLLYIEFNAQEV